MKILICSIIAFTFLSCVSENGPEYVLKSFIDQRFSGGVDKEDFSKFFAGELLEDIATLDESTIGKLNEVKDFKKYSYKMNFKRCDEEKCFLTYTLIFDATAISGKSNSRVRVKVKKIAELRRDDMSWKIHGISDIKTHYDYKELKSAE